MLSCCRMLMMILSVDEVKPDPDVKSSDEVYSESFDGE
jgi:hypothetical protein